MAIANSSSFETDLDFYIDYEIYHNAGGFTQSVTSNAQILSFPTKDCGGFAASMPLEGAIASGCIGNPFSVIPSWMESGGDDKSMTMNRRRPVVTSTVGTEQVSKFWELYQAYPKYLKNVQKRQKRRNRKKATQSSE